MSYKLKFLSSALKEWHKMPPELKAQFKAHLGRRFENPYKTPIRNLPKESKLSFYHTNDSTV